MLFYHNDKYLLPYLFCAPTSPCSLYCHGTLKSRKTFSYFNSKRIKDKVLRGNSTAQSFPSIPRKIFDPHKANREGSLFPHYCFFHFAVPRPCILKLWTPTLSSIRQLTTRTKQGWKPQNGDGEPTKNRPKISCYSQGYRCGWWVQCHVANGSAALALMQDSIFGCSKCCFAHPGGTCGILSEDKTIVGNSSW